MIYIYELASSGEIDLNEKLVYTSNYYHGVRLLERFKKAKWKMITNKDMEYNTANKGGWSGKAIHDVAIVFEENPYILVVTSNLGEGGYRNLFMETSRLVGEMHDSYWSYKVDICSNIKLY